ncbi:MAG: HAD hydrolase-like protein [Chloroflexi bacterium]|nr:HAD hydrolase-like protein [Chloroflexota bacterium]
MTLTLLLDLDDTLLDSDMNDFIPVYFQTLGKEMQAYIEPKKMLKYLMLGTEAMIANDSPAQRLEECFNNEFYPKFDIGRDTLDPIIAHFYEEIFPSLSYLVKARPEAVALVEWAFSQGYRVAISTNPLFPRAAIKHRLRWAGLAPEKYPFDIISSFEHFHYSKPNPAYFGEVLGRMGWPDGPVLIVGDDPERDLRAAQELGVAAYWIADDDALLPEGVNPPQGRGKIGELRGWIEAQDEKIFTPSYQAKTAIVATAKAVPAALKGMLAGIPSGAWTEFSDPDEWTLVEILSHLRDVEREVNLPRFQTFLNEENPFITANDPDRWVSERVYAKNDGEAVLQEYVDARLETLEALKKLSAEDWQRAGRHAIFGPITLQEQLGFMVEHDRVHLRQIYKQIMG